MTDYEIIIDIVGGDKEKFRLLMEKYQQMVFRTCMGYVHDKEEADDLTQEVFIQVYQSLSKFKMESAFSTWLYRIAINASLNRVRKMSINSVLGRIESLFGLEKDKASFIYDADTDDPEILIIKEEHKLWLQNALDRLPENQRTAIILSKYDDLSQKEIAGIMNITEGAVEALLQRAKKNLREKLTAGEKKNRK